MRERHFEPPMEPPAGCYWSTVSTGAPSRRPPLPMAITAPPHPPSFFAYCQSGNLVNCMVHNQLYESRNISRNAGMNATVKRPRPETLEGKKSKRQERGGGK